MWLEEIEADRLRNLRAVNLRLDAGLTVVYGSNGQGKTSLLEAAYMLGTGRSFRTRRMEELVSWEGGPLRVAGAVVRRVGRARLSVVIDDGERRLSVDGAEQELEDFLGRLDVVDLTAERAHVLRGAPEERRRFLDRGVVGLDPLFLRSLGEYRRVLGQRNALLRSGRARGEEMAAWDERLVWAAGDVHRRRRRYAVMLAAGLGEAVRALFPDGESLTLRYRPSPAAAGEVDPGRFDEIFLEKLTRGLERDRILGFTSSGPHRDDLAVELGGKDLRKFGSAGQVRASLIALKLGKLSLLQTDRGEAPLFLMDDYDSDLDETRAAALGGFLNAGGFQAVVATSKESLAARLGVSCSKVRVDDGMARPTS